MQDSLAERGEFELPIPIAEQPDDNVMSGSGAQTKRRDRIRVIDWTTKTCVLILFPRTSCRLDTADLKHAKTLLDELSR